MRLVPENSFEMGLKSCQGTAPALRLVETIIQLGCCNFLRKVRGGSCFCSSCASVGIHSNTAMNKDSSCLKNCRHNNDDPCLDPG